MSESEANSNANAVNTPPTPTNKISVTVQRRTYKNATHKAQGEYIENLALQKRIKSAVKISK